MLTVEGEWGEPRSPQTRSAEVGTRNLELNELKQVNKHNKVKRPYALPTNSL